MEVGSPRPVILLFLFCSVIGGDVPWWNGLNVPWNLFGNDIGSQAFNVTFFEEFFSVCDANSINSARFWLHCDGRGSPWFNDDGTVSGLSPTFLPDLELLVSMAKRHRVVLLIALWSFDICNYEAPGGHHPDLISNSTKTESYIENAFIPMLQAMKPFENIVWEVINEPEWCIQQTPATTSVSVDLSDMQRFVSLIVNAVHSYSTQKVTVGSASLKWNSDQSPAVGNWWKDEVLLDGAFLDFYEIHYYDWMYPYYVPADNTTTSWSLDKPALIGELEANAGTYFQPFSFMNLSFNNGFIGSIFWVTIFLFPFWILHVMLQVL